jgi:hypothetical protein
VRDEPFNGGGVRAVPPELNELVGMSFPGEIVQSS